LPKFRGRRKKRAGKRKVPKNVKKYVKRVIDNMVEDKYDNQISVAQSLVPDGSGLLLLTSYIPPGDLQGQRVGVKVRIKKVQIILQLMPTAITADSGMVRILFFRDKATNADPVAPVIPYTNGVGLFGTTMNASVSHLAPYNLSQVPKRFEIYYDKYFHVNNHGGSTNQSGRMVVKIRKTWKSPLPVYYNTGTNGDERDINQNALWFLLIGENQACQWQASFQTTFEDA